MNPLIKKFLYAVSAVIFAVLLFYTGQVALQLLKGQSGDGPDGEMVVQSNNNEHELHQRLRDNDEYYRVETETPPLTESIVLLEEALRNTESTGERHHLQFMLYKLRLYTEEGPKDPVLISDIIDFGHDIQVSNATRASTLALLERRYYALLKSGEDEDTAAEFRQLVFSDERLSGLYVEGSQSQTSKNYNEYVFAVSALPDVGIQIALELARSVSAEVLLNKNPNIAQVDEWRADINRYLVIADREISALKSYLEGTRNDTWSLYSLGNPDRLYLTLLTAKAETLMHLTISNLPDVDDPAPYFEEAVNTPFVTLDSNRYFLKTYAALEYAEYLVNREYYFAEDHTEQIHELTTRVVADDQKLEAEQRAAVRGEIARMEFNENERYYYEEMAKKDETFKEYLLNEIGWESADPLPE